MSSGCGDVLSLEDLKTAKKHQIFEAEVITGKAGGLPTGNDIDFATNQVTGQTQKTLPQILIDLGAQVQPWSSSTGGVLTSPSEIFLNDTPGSLGLGDYYAWGGSFPKTVPAGVDPALPGSGYILRSSQFIKSIAFEAIRRSYEGSGLLLVGGSFESGGTLNSSFDVLLKEADGKAYSSPGPFPQTVSPGSSTTGFIDRSMSPISFIQSGSGALLRSSQDKMREFVSPEDFGAVGDGVTDDTQAIQNAVNHGNIINFKSKVYKIAGTVLLPDNTWLHGSPGTEFLGIMTPEGGGVGGYPNQMFRNSDTTNGNRSISFTNIKFNFAKGAFNYVAGSSVTTINSLFFFRVSDLVFEDCYFYDFVTNFNNTLTGKDLLKFGMAMLDSCDRVRFNRIVTDNIREEVFNCYECFQLDFSGWRGIGEVVKTSSHGGFWYCDGVSVRDARFSHTGGSVLNCCSRNVVFDNISVNDDPTLSQAGRGFDFGNEMDIKSFEVGNISVTNCSLKVDGYGLFLQTSANFNDVVECLNIENNRFYVQKGVTSFLYGIRISPANSVNIRNNLIYLSDATTESQGQCVMITLLDSLYASNIQIRGNTMRGLTGVFCQNNVKSSIDGLYIDGNTFTSQNKGSLASSAGASVFVFFRNNSSAVSGFDISNVYVQNNNCLNLGGGYFLTTFDLPAVVRLSNINVIGNIFNGASSGMDRSISVQGGTGASTGTCDIRICKNTVYDGSTINIINMKYAFIDRNIFKWSTETTLRRVNIAAHNGIFEMTNNRIINASQTSQPDMVQSGSTFSLLAVTGNSSSSSAGTLSWTKPTLPANTTLPN